MAIGFRAVPEWDSWTNQGGGVAVADLDGDGQPELVVLRVDHAPPGPNRAFYRVGQKLDAQGAVQGFGPWLEIPDWGSRENEGANIAVTRFANSGLALVVVQVEQRVPGPNLARFRVGRSLDAAGRVTGGWSAWQAVPGWFSWRNQGAAVAVRDLDGDGAPELVVFQIDDFHTDNPRRPNKGFYRVGRHLNDDGTVAGWSDWFEVDWFSWFNQGAGIALEDLDGDGRPELVVFQIDDPPAENAGFYRVGWKLDAQGRVEAGWGPWVRLDGWGSFRDEGGGFALGSFGAGRPKAVVFHIDGAAALNAGLYAVTELVLDIDAASDKGVWRLLPYFSEVLPVHAGLLHTGKVLFFAGSGNNVFRQRSVDFGNVAREVYTSVVWDPTKSVFDAATFAHPATQKRQDGSVIDLFCCGHTLLADGRILVAGGTDQYDKVIAGGVMQGTDHGFTGTRDCLIFDPLPGTWKTIRPTQHGRWYPTVVGLSDGSALAASGLDEHGKGAQNDTLERNQDPDHAGWVGTRDFVLPLYPHLFELEDGRLLFTGGKMDTERVFGPFAFDPLHATAAEPVGAFDDLERTNQCASVILPPAQDQRFMLLGGGPEDDGPVRGQATQRVAIVDFKQQPRAYAAATGLHHERMHVNAVLLPDRTVLAVGGGVTREASVAEVVDPQGGREVFEAEVFDPATGRWSITAPATIARLYHSVALLLPDGRVVAAGGNPDKGSQVAWLPPDPLEEMRLEIFSPPYLFKKPNRPLITHAPAQVTYDATVSIQTPAPADVKWVSLIRPGLTTHSFNGTQRLVDLPITSRAAAALSVRVPVNRALAPPGWYMLFLTDHDGVPSVASWVELG